MGVDARPLVVLGADPGTKYLGLFVLQDGAPLHSEAWRSDPDSGLHDNMMRAYRRASFIIAVHRVRLVIVERDQSARNMDTVRKLSYFEAMVILAARVQAVEVVQVAPQTARKAGLGKGNLGKEECYEIIKAELRGTPYALPPENKGGLDIADACVLAKAGPEVSRGAVKVGPETPI